MISTVHYPHDIIICSRRKTRLTATNKSHVEIIWDESPTKTIAIPKFIHDYINFMNGLIFDQRIASYAPNLLCPRVCIPLMLKCLQIMRNNMYIIYRSMNTENALTQKGFVICMCEPLSRRLIGRNLRSTVSVLTPSSRPQKRFRMSSTNPRLPNIRKDRPMSIHCWVLRVEKRQCIYCRFLRAKLGKEARREFVIRQVRRACAY